MPQFIAIAGNIGVGKSELTRRLAERLGWKPYLEPAEDNPYLKNFYGDMNRWGFHSQIFFLAHRLRQHSELAKTEGGVIQDRSVYENAEVFAKNLHKRGILSEHDWNTYRLIYKTLIALLPPPDLIIYLHASVPVLMERIEARDREFEQKVDPEYLFELSSLYEEWADSFKLAPVLKVNTNKINFPADDSALDRLVKDILSCLPHQPLPLFNPKKHPLSVSASLKVKRYDAKN